MAVNTLATATLFQKMLDKVAVQEATTGWMDANAGQVIYNGGAEGNQKDDPGSWSSVPVGLDGH